MESAPFDRRLSLPRGRPRLRFRRAPGGRSSSPVRPSLSQTRSWPARSWPRLSPARRFAAPSPAALRADGAGLPSRSAISSMRVGQRDRVRARRLRDRRIDLAPVDVRAEAALAHGHRAAVRMLAEQAPADAAARRLGREQRDRLVERQARRIGSLRQRRVDLAVIDVSAEAALLDADRAALGCSPSTRPAPPPPKREAPAPLSLATMRSIARLPPISSTSSSRPRLA